MSIQVIIEEEYGYRNWLWETGMDASALEEFWKSLASVGPLFFNLSDKLPGDVLQIYPDLDDPEHKAWILPNDDGTMYARIYDPKDCWHAHIHMDNDSFLATDEGRDIFHAGKVSDEEYYSDDYQNSPEVQAEWDKAMADQLQAHVQAYTDK
jgi:hypothetical protein